MNIFTPPYPFAYRFDPRPVPPDAKATAEVDAAERARNVERRARSWGVAQLAYETYGEHKARCPRCRVEDHTFGGTLCQRGAALEEVAAEAVTIAMVESTR